MTELIYLARGFSLLYIIVCNYIRYYTVLIINLYEQEIMNDEVSQVFSCTLPLLVINICFFRSLTDVKIPM